MFDCGEGIAFQVSGVVVERGAFPRAFVRYKFGVDC
jgi:hypothetical protein